MDTHFEFTDLVIRRLEATDKTVTYRDKSSQLALRVAPSGLMVWEVCVRVKHGPQRRITLGRYPDVSLKDARDKSRALVTQAKQGIDPSQPERQMRQSPTVAELMEAYLELYERPRKRSARNNEYTLRKHLATVMARKAASITRHDVLAILDSIPGTQSNRVLALIRKMWGWALIRYDLPGNPCQGVERLRLEEPKARTLTSEELRTIWRATEVLCPPKVEAAIKLMLLTGQRLGEVLAMRREHLDLEGATWTIPSEASKNRRPNLVPLVSHAVTVCASLQGEQKTGLVLSTVRNPNMVPSRPDGPLRTLVTKTGILFTFHDIRRTVSTGMAKLGTHPDIISRVLNHVQPGVTARHYNLYDYLPEKREALEHWQAHLMSLMN